MSLISQGIHKTYLLLIAALIICPIQANAQYRDAKFIESLKKHGYGQNLVTGELIVGLKSSTSADAISTATNQTTIQSKLEIESSLKLGSELRELRPLFKSLGSKDIHPTNGKVQVSADSANASAKKLQDVFLVLLNGSEDPAIVIDKLRKNPNVAWVEPNLILRASAVPNDHFFSTASSWTQSYDDMWALKIIHAPEAWDYVQGEGVTVAVLDTGLDYTHPDIASNVWSNTSEIAGNGIDDDHNGYIDDYRGWDFTTCAESSELGCTKEKPQDNDPLDGNGHGTHVSGTIAAVANNGIGIAGVAPKSKIMPLKVLSDGGSGSLIDIAEAVIYAADNGADVLNASLGGPGDSELLRLAFNYAADRGVISVVAAGNEDADIQLSTPASIESVIAVSSTDENDLKSNFSNFSRAPVYGPKTPIQVAVAAPGGGSGNMSSDKTGKHIFNNILSLRAKGTDMYEGAANYTAGSFAISDGLTPGGYQYYRSRGTSMASPHAAGVSALIVSKYLADHPGASRSNAAVRKMIHDDGIERLKGTTDALAPQTETYQGQAVYIGTGRINALKAVTANPKPVIRVVGDILDETTGNGNRVLDAGESGQLVLELEDSWLASSNVKVDISSLDLQLASVVSGSATFGAISVGSHANNQSQPFLIKAGTFTGMKPVTFNLHLSVDSTAGHFESDQPIVVFLGARKLTSSAKFQNIISPLNYLPAIAPSADRFQPENEPLIDGSRAVWTDTRNGNDDVFLFDLSSNQTRALSSDIFSQSHPTISGDRIVWQDNRSGNWDLYSYSAASGAAAQPVPVMSSQIANDQIQPRLSGDSLVWTELPSTENAASGIGDEVFYLNLKSLQLLNISQKNSDQVDAHTSGASIAYQDQANLGIYVIPNVSSPSSKFDIFSQADYAYHPYLFGNTFVAGVFDAFGNTSIQYSQVKPVELTLTPPRTLLASPYYKIFPKINDRYLVWQEASSDSSWDIYSMNLASGVTKQISNNGLSNQTPALYGRNIVWASDSIVWLSDIEGGAPITDDSLPPTTNLPPVDASDLDLKFRASYKGKKKSLSMRVELIQRSTSQEISGETLPCTYEIYAKKYLLKKGKSKPLKLASFTSELAALDFNLVKMPAPGTESGVKKISIYSKAICTNQVEVQSKEVGIKLGKTSSHTVPAGKWLGKLKSQLKKIH